MIDRPANSVTTVFLAQHPDFVSILGALTFMKFNDPQFQNQLLTQFHSALPPQIHQSVRKRQIEFLCGRWALHQSLQAMEINSSVPIGIRDSLPDLPPDVCGSISHSNHWAAAVVFQKKLINQIGIDLEEWFDEETCQQIGTSIATEEEVKSFATLSGDKSRILTLIFSAKEAFFKFYWPSNKTVLEFSDIKIQMKSDTELHVEGRTKDSEFFRTYSPSIRYWLFSEFVFTIAAPLNFFSNLPAHLLDPKI